VAHAPTIDLANVPWEAQEVDRWLRDGNPTLGWRGDPRLSLAVGVLTASRNGVDPRTKKFHRAGDVLARRYEVVRHCEDGTDQRIMQRPLTKLHEIIPALNGIDPRTPAFEPVMDVVEREDAQKQKDVEYKIGQAIGEQREHLWKLVADRQNGLTTFRQMGGSDERSDRNLVKP